MPVLELILKRSEATEAVETAHEDLDNEESKYFEAFCVLSSLTRTTLDRELQK